MALCTWTDRSDRERNITRRRLGPPFSVSVSLTRAIDEASSGRHVRRPRFSRRFLRCWSLRLPLPSLCVDGPARRGPARCHPWKKSHQSSPHHTRGKHSPPYATPPPTRSAVDRPIAPQKGMSLRATLRAASQAAFVPPARPMCELDAPGGRRHPPSTRRPWRPGRGLVIPAHRRAGPVFTGSGAWDEAIRRL